jgi:hypothetical protein
VLEPIGVQPVERGVVDVAAPGVGDRHRAIVEREPYTFAGLS